MCGINGIVNFKDAPTENKDVVKRMNDVLEKRGPDEEGIFVSKTETVTLGNRRLSIVDLEQGKQPLSIVHNDIEYAITLNGEIFNHKELRAILEKEGIEFLTNSDTEVLLRSYIKWGFDCLDKLNGQFGFAIYDGKDESIFFARDKVGIKPLFYSLLNSGNTLVMSSQAKGILQHPEYTRKPDYETIADFFLGSSTFTNSGPPSDRSFFDGISSLKPGHYAVFNKDGLETYEYYDNYIPSKKDQERDYVKEFKEVFTEAILKRVPDEVKYGAALSGGLDSSVVSSVVSRNMDDPLTSFTIKFEDSQANPDYENAKLMAEQENIDLLSPTLTSKELIGYTDPMITAMDAPHDTIRQLGLYATYKGLHEAGCKVVLVGEGADEFNLGYYCNYPGFKIEEGKINSSKDLKEQFERRIPFVSKYFTEEFLSKIDFSNIIDKNVEENYDRCTSDDPIDKMTYYYTKRFLQYRLDANDRCAMAHSVEARVPFCDPDVVKISLAVPNDLNLGCDTEKFVIREAFSNYLPEEIANRPKYPLPESKDLEIYELIIEEVEKNIQTVNPSVWKIFNKDSIKDINNQFKTKITKLKEDGKGREELTSENPITGDIEYKIKHLYTILTFLRWYDINEL